MAKPKQKKAMPTAQQLADRFVAVLWEWMQDDGYRDGTYVGLNANQGWNKMCVDNADQGPNRGTCASHDWCDANMAMDAAFRFYGVDPLPGDGNGMSQATTDLWNEAWRLVQPVLDGRVDYRGPK